MVNYVKEIVIRIDLPETFEFSETDVPKEIKKEVLKRFPIPEPRIIQGKALQFSDKEFIQKDLEKKEWHFFDSNREKELVFAENAFIISYKKYEEFNKMKDDWSLIINSIFDKYPEIQVNRFGLRYVNHIQLDADKNKWKYTINEKLLHNFQLGLDNISRGFSIINLNENGTKTNFQYGIHNPDFPSPIKNNLFILDIDVFYEGILTKKDIFEYTETFHGMIKSLFSLSTSDLNE